jgi:hypothetical protein
MMNAQMKEGVLIGQIEQMLRVRYYLPPLEVRSQYEREFKKFAQWCDVQGLQPMPTNGHVVAAFLLDLVFDGKSPDEIMQAANAVAYAHELAQQYLDLAPMRAAIVYARMDRAAA